MEALFVQLLTAILGGGPSAIFALLIAFILLLLIDRKRLTNEISKKDEKIEKIIDEYSRGNLTIAQALDNLKTVLYEIRGRIR